MLTTRANTTEVSWADKAKIVAELLKIRLSLLVAFSACFGYVFACGRNVVWTDMIGLALGGFLITGCAIIINQILEKNIDKQMQRTQNRPLPTEKVTIQEAISLAFVVGLAGFFFLIIATNWLTVFLASLSVVLYSFVYTPLKKVGSIAVFVGAIPGALPPLLGWVAATNQISWEAISIFAVQFIWQFPHFWAIAWVLDEDYSKVGFKMLPSKIGRPAATYIVAYTLLLIPISMIPFWGGLIGSFAAFAVTFAGILFLLPTIKLWQDSQKKFALYIMFASFLYLPFVQIVYLLDRL
ncbi:MAG: heme o synthase [Microscillaceae bacterium]|nr:heme o synthase [Microscillaceae bacterium]MDW8461728.1 heme o synthase [Cytophagales bacterium]